MNKISQVLFGCLIAFTAAADLTTNCYQFAADVWIDSQNPTAVNNTGGYIIDSRLGTRRSVALIKLDVRNMSAVEEAWIELLVSQQVQKWDDNKLPALNVSVLETTDWDETSACWNTFANELTVWPAPFLATNDVHFVALFAGKELRKDNWVKIDVTRAVRARALVDGWLTLQLSQPPGYAPYSDPICFRNKEAESVSERPKFYAVFNGEGPAGPDPTGTASTYPKESVRKPINAGSLGTENHNISLPFNPGGISTRIIYRDPDVPMTRYAAFSFDARGLEDVPRARFRFYLQKDGNSVLPTAMRTLRVSAAVTAPWESDQLCWDKPILELGTTSISGEIGRIIYSGTNEGGDHGWCEVDATEVVHKAAKTGRQVTFMISHDVGNVTLNDVPIVAEGNGNEPYLIFTDRPANFTASVEPVDREDGKHPVAVEVSWTPAASSGVKYKVERSGGETAGWQTVADNLSALTWTDLKAYPGNTYTYRITATVGASEYVTTVEHTFSPDKRYEAVADTYVYSGAASASYATDQQLQLKCANGQAKDAIVTFDLAALPDKFEKVEAVFHIIGNYKNCLRTGDADVATRPRLDIRYIATNSYIEAINNWTEADGLSWTQAFGSKDIGLASARCAYTSRGGSTAISQFTDMPNLVENHGGEICGDFTEIVRSLRREGQRYLHAYLMMYDSSYGTCEVNVFSRNSIYDAETRPHLRVTMKNWSKPGMVMIVR